jgi:hypothetical protein
MSFTVVAPEMVAAAASDLQGIGSALSAANAAAAGPITQVVAAAAQVGAGVVQPVSLADTNTTYVLIPNENLPLLQALHGSVPAPVLDLVEPDLRVIMEMGYDRTGYADVPSPVGLFPTHINPIAVAHDLAQGTVQGIDNALADEGLPALPHLPNLPFLWDLSSTSLPTLSPGGPATIPVPPQIGGVIDGPLNRLDGWISTAINEQADPATTCAIHNAGDSLSAYAMSHGASSQLANASYIGEQILPMDVEGPGVLVTADTHYLVSGIEDLAAGSLAGFIQNLQLIPAADLALIAVGVALPALAAPAIVAGNGFPL